MSGDRLRLRVELDAGAGADAEENDAAARALREALLDLDVDAVDRPRGAVPDGARAAEAIAAGSLLVTLAPHALDAAGRTIQGWISRAGGRRVALELDGDRIELTGASADEQRRLVDAFVARHAHR